jgi:tetratricopeptide (TPR) repeat protein
LNPVRVGRVHRATILRLSGVVTEPAPGTVPRDESAHASPAPTGRRRDVVAVLPILPLVAVLVAIVPLDGGFAATTWYPTALLVLGVLLAAAAGVGARFLGAPRSSWLAVAALAAFTAWNYASIAWADARGDAWDGANRTLLYLLVYTLCARWPATPRSVAASILVFAGGVAAVGVFMVARVVVSEEPGEVFVGERLWAPLGYPNATAALFMLACWPVVGLASRRWLPAAARILAFGLAALLLQLSLLAQSRGSVYTLPVVALLYLAIVPGRLRSLLAVSVVAACVAPALETVLDVYSAAGDDEVVQRAGDALAALLASSAAAAAAGAAVVWADGRVRVPRRAQVACWAAVAAAAVIGAAVVLGRVSPVDEVEDAWTSFRHGGTPTSESSHFSGFGSNRYDFWRVSLLEFRDHPVGGIGSDNFAVQYLQQRRSDEQALYPHSLLVRIGLQTGVVGLVLYAAFLAFAFAAAAAAPPGSSREVAGIAVVGFGVWLVQAQVDWLWEVPVLGAGAALLLGLAGGLARRPRPAGGEVVDVSRRRRVAVLVVGVTAAVVATLTLALPWLSARAADRAVETWRSDPEGADTLLARARVLNPLSERPDMLRGVIFSKQGRYERMRESFERAVERAPSSWYANFELGVASALTGRREEAVRRLERAHALNPNDEIVASVLADLRAGRRPDPDVIDRRFLGRIEG